MKYSLIALAVMASLGPLPEPEKDEIRPVGLTDDELPEEARDLVRELEKIAVEARYAADPRQPAASTAAALAAYFRTPDPVVPV